MSECPKCHEQVPDAYRRLHDGCVYCEGRRNREESDRLSAAIKAIKNDPPQTLAGERDEIKRLIALGHPDAERCIKAICHPPERPPQRRRA